jgi:glutathione peroxidase
MSPFLSSADSESMNLYDIDLVTIDGKPQKMDDYRSKTLLIVNVASQCGFTPQYEGLQALYDKFEDRGFVVLGFPCNQFGHQEPGGAKQRSSSSAPGTTASPSPCSQRST